MKQELNLPLEITVAMPMATDPKRHSSLSADFTNANDKRQTSFVE